jgi:glycosyltransferase involved in cell wall biosynthesis
VGVKHAILKYFWLTRPLRHAALATTISNAMRDQIVQLLPWAEEKVRVIPVAISDRFRKSPIHSPRPKVHVLQIGTAPNKNIDRLLEATKGLNLRLTVVGKEYDGLAEKMKSWGGDYVRKSGLSDDEILKEYEKTDIVSFVSTYEGFGMPILEAQAVGRPVITSNIGSMKEVASDSGAVLVNPFNVNEIRYAFGNLIADRDSWNKRISCGEKNVLRYNGHSIALQYLNLYRQLDSCISA